MAYFTEKLKSLNFVKIWLSANPSQKMMFTLGDQEQDIASSISFQEKYVIVEMEVLFSRIRAIFMYSEKLNEFWEVFSKVIPK